MVKIISCTCNHEFQDACYGAGKRVHNVAPKYKAFRCTVCKQLNGSFDPNKKDAGSVQA